MDAVKVSEYDREEIRSNAEVGHYDLVEVYILRDTLRVDCAPLKAKERPKERKIPVGTPVDSFTRASDDMLEILSQHTNPEVKMLAIMEKKRREVEE